MSHTWLSSTATKTYPLGKGTAYRPVDISFTNPTSPVLRLEVFNANAGGAKGTLNAISTVRYYQSSLISGTATGGGSIKITFGADDGITSSATLVVAQSTTAGGTYATLGQSANDASSVTSSSYNPASGAFFLLGDTGTNLLPVELTSFTAAVRNGKVELTWATATEINNYGFEVERSVISNQLSVISSSVGSRQSAIGNWEKVGFVEGHGTTNAPQNYSFSDAAARVGKFSYRLKQIDRDGKFEYHQAVEVTLGISPNTVWLDNNYPNPFNPSTKISFVLGTTGNASLKVFDLLGKEVVTLADGIFNSGELQSVTFDASKYPSGIYYYQLKSGNKTEMKKMLLLK
jgi:hypothetical protein